jgi:hypothetical protein
MAVLPPQGIGPVRIGWQQIERTAAAKYIVPWATLVAYPAVYFGIVTGADNTALYDWLFDRVWYAVFPFFMLMWVWIGFAPTIAQRTYIRKQLKKRAAAYRCLVCGYQLHGVPVASDGASPRCPECGTPSDRADYTGRNTEARK